jgi:hypothetical protein
MEATYLTKYQLPFNGLHNILYRMIRFIINTTMKNSNLVSLTTHPTSGNKLSRTQSGSMAYIDVDFGLVTGFIRLN